jgi:hypothetical protein
MCDLAASTLYWLLSVRGYTTHRTNEQTCLGADILVPEEEPSTEVFRRHVFGIGDHELADSSQNDVLDRLGRESLQVHHEDGCISHPKYKNTIIHLAHHIGMPVQMLEPLLCFQAPESDLSVIDCCFIYIHG